MANMQKTLNDVIDNLEKEYPQISFNISENQTELLDYTISNLKQNLILALHIYLPNINDIYERYQISSYHRIQHVYITGNQSSIFLPLSHIPEYCFFNRAHSRIGNDDRQFYHCNR